MILNESQHDRDIELSELTNTLLEEIYSYEICGTTSIKVYDDNLPEPKTEEEFISIYQNYEFLHFKSYLRTLMFTSVKKRHPELLRIIKESKNKECLDYGSGVGTHALALAENNNQVTILDVKGPLLLFAIRRFKRRNLNCTPLTNYDNLPINRYDLVICSDVLEHVYDPITKLKEILDSLKPGGILHILVSDMIKPTSGHFSTSIERWRLDGSSLLDTHCLRIGETLYQKLK